MKLPKIKDIGPSGAIIFSGILISLSIFITGLMFLGNAGTKTKIPTRTNAPTPLTPEQIKKIQEDRAATMQKRTAPATTTESE
jgi:hypothetical protein